jgi:hypothetical protein
MIYQWHEARRHAADPQQVGELVEALSKAGHGHQTAPALVEAARDPDSPAHPLFDWEDEEAAEKWRVYPARRPPGSLLIEVIDSRGNVTTAPGFYHVRTIENQVVREGYRLSVDVLADENLRQKALQEALRYLAGFQRRFRQLEELRPVFEAIDQIAETLNGEAEESA